MKPKKDEQKTSGRVPSDHPCGVDFSAALAGRVPLSAGEAASTFIQPESGTRHDFVQEWSAESPYCGAMVMRNGGGDTCGLTREQHDALAWCRQDQRRTW